jgi:hypothetical protein
MPFHHIFGPPHFHFFALHMTAALAAAGAAFYVVRNGLPSGVARAGANLKNRVSAWRDASADGTSASSFFKRRAGQGGTGNTAFDAYRNEELGKLEAEAAEFRAHLDGLRGAKDKAEFDRFMAERRAGRTDDNLPA